MVFVNSSAVYQSSRSKLFAWYANWPYANQQIKMSSQARALKAAPCLAIVAMVTFFVLKITAFTGDDVGRMKQYDS